MPGTWKKISQGQHWNFDMNLLVFSLAILRVSWYMHNPFQDHWHNLSCWSGPCCYLAGFGWDSPLNLKMPRIEWICVHQALQLSVGHDLWSRSQGTKSLITFTFSTLSASLTSVWKSLTFTLEVSRVQSVPEISAGWCQRMMASWCCWPFIKEKRKRHQWRQVTDTSSASILSVRSTVQHKISAWPSEQET